MFKGFISSWFLDYYKRCENDWDRDDDETNGENGTVWNPQDKQAAIFKMVCGWFFYGIMFYYLYKIAMSFANRKWGKKTEGDDLEDAQVCWPVANEELEDSDD